MSKNMMIAIIAAVVLVGGGVGAYMFMKKDDTKDSNNSSKTTTNDTVAKKYTDACKLFSKDEMNAALGGSFGEGEEDISFTTATPGTPDYDNEELRGSACSFDRGSGSDPEGMTFSVDIKTYADVAKAKAYMSDLRNPQTAEGQAAVDVVDVDKVGDEAFFVVLDAAEQSKNESLDVLVGRQVIVLSVTQLGGLDRDAVRAGLEALGLRL